MTGQPAKKSLGQHWLNDDSALTAMCDSAQVQAGDFVLEIGPGLGALTEKLLERSATVLALEYDQSLVEKLNARFDDYGEKFKLEYGDVLQFDFGKLPPGYKVVANIPYYLTSNLLRRLCETENNFSEAALLVQKEVAERVVAKPGAMSLLSVSVQLYCNVSLGRVVGAGLFEPQPKVDSQILILKHLGRPKLDIEPVKFFRLVKAGFSERRKKLRSSLSGGLGISKTEVETMLDRSRIDPNLRAQALSLEDWHKIYRTYTNND